MACWKSEFEEVTKTVSRKFGVPMYLEGLYIFSARKWLFWKYSEVEVESEENREPGMLTTGKVEVLKLQQVDSMYHGDRVSRVAVSTYSLATPGPIDVTNTIELYGGWLFPFDVLGAVTYKSRTLSSRRWRAAIS